MNLKMFGLEKLIENLNDLTCCIRKLISIHDGIDTSVSKEWIQLISIVISVLLGIWMMKKLWSAIADPIIHT